MKQLLKALHMGVWISSGLIIIAAWFLLKELLGGIQVNGSDVISPAGIWGSIVTGLVAGLIIAWGTEYFTSYEHKPTQRIAKQAETGPATVIISGIAEGMLSTWIPLLTIVFAIMLSFLFSGGGENFLMGVFGVGIAAVGMLSTLAITLATDAYGPIADNAGGNAEMTHQEPTVRQRTDMLDALGNTTAATGKGFAIGSAALTALALLAAYVITVKTFLVGSADATGMIEIGTQKLAADGLTIKQIMMAYNVTLVNPKVLCGLFLGVMMVFVFCAMTMNAVGRAANEMMLEARRQFGKMREAFKKQGMSEGDIADPTKWPYEVEYEGHKYPDYNSCVAISTQSALRQMVVPAVMAVVIPVLIGLVLGVPGVMGLLVGALTCGFAVAIYMANAGGAWDNAKKYIETGELGGKGSENHKATVVGDTVGDPFKDTSGPSINILIKLMSIVSVVFAGLSVKYAPAIAEILHLNN
jgi:K(+)-stimulated pyrophosphate-energized sodium pump